MKHDRSVIDAKGGVWPTIADAVRVDAEAIAKTGRPVRTAPRPAECDELTNRRIGLGLSPKQFARAARLHKSTIYTVETGVSGAEALQRYRAALEQLERERG